MTTDGDGQVAERIADVVAGLKPYNQKKLVYEGLEVGVGDGTRTMQAVPK